MAALAQLGREDLLKFDESTDAVNSNDLQLAIERLCDMYETPAPIVFNKAMILAAACNFNEAYLLLTEALSQDAYLVVARFQRGLVAHRLQRNEQAMQDFQKCLQLMRGLYINYSTLGLDFVLCRHHVEFNLAAVQQLLGLQQMARDMYKTALATKASMEKESKERTDADIHIAKHSATLDQLQISLPALTDLTVEPCRMSHNVGTCPLIKVPRLTIYKPHGLVSDILNRKRSSITLDKATLLYGRPGHHHEVGFEGRIRRDSLQPMFVNTKQSRARHRRPSKAMETLVKGIGQTSLFLAMGRQSRQERGASDGNIQTIKPPTLEDLQLAEMRQARSRSLYNPAPLSSSSSGSSPCTNSYLRRKASQDSHQLYSDDITHDVTTTEAPETVQTHGLALDRVDERSVLEEEETEDLSQPDHGEEVDSAGEEAEEDDAREGTRVGHLQLSEDLPNPIPAFKKLSVGRASSVEVLYNPSSAPEEEVTYDANSPPQVDSAISSQEDDDSQSDPIEVNVNTTLTPSTLRDLAVFLEHIQDQHGGRQMVVHVHMHEK
ncbi:uncharacterized protein LOC135821054 [Sycon ciliatum]|uniref:uncharacterized protein LOC135821054 n=1 Tax=Sycon ciliatum TaxID=27933 RepID=UPI0031F61147